VELIEDNAKKLIAITFGVVCVCHICQSSASAAGEGSCVKGCSQSQQPQIGKKQLIQNRMK
jgi:uncharacterized protein YuzB (UPF0349 family)